MKNRRIKEIYLEKSEEEKLNIKANNKLVKVIQGENAIQLIPPNELTKDKKITILSDGMFKTMFVNQNRLEYSAKLIAPYVNVDYDILKNKIKLINSELDKDSALSKGERADYVAEIDDVITNIEVNCNGSLDTLLRNLDFSHRLYARKIKVGSDYDFTKCLQININNFKFQGIDDVVSEFYLRDEQGNILTDKLRYINISIPNLRTKCYNYGIEALTEEERYILSLVETDIEKAKEIGMGDYFMLKGIEDQIEFGKNPEILEAYDKEWAYKSWGYQEGHTEGYESGHSEGRAEEQATIINKMLEKGKTLEEISDLLDIHKNEIEKILNKKNNE